MQRNDQMIKKEYLRNLFPMIFSVLGGTINTFIDSAFVSNVMGGSALAAINMALPVYLLMCTIGSLLGGGASVLSSQRAGKEKMGDAQALYGEAWSWSLIIGGILTLCGCVFCTPISMLLSQGGALYGLVYTYVFYTCIGTIPNIVLYIIVNYLQLEGKTQAITRYMQIMIGTDILFDYWFMVVFSWGMMGAALASVLSVLLACLYGIWQLESGFSNYHLQLKIGTMQQLLQIVRAGSPLAMGNFYDSVRTIFMNGVILRVGGTDAAEIMAVLNAMSEIGICITYGVPAAAGPMTGLLYVNRENDALRDLYRFQSKVGVILSVSYAILLFAGQRIIAVVFATQQSIAVPLLCMGLFCIFDMNCSIYSNYVNKCNHMMLANYIVFMRRMLCPILSLQIVAILGIYLWSYLPVMAVFTMGVSRIGVVLFQKKHAKDVYPLEGILLLDDHLIREKKVLDFSVEPTEQAICGAAGQLGEFCQENEMSVKMTVKLEMAIEELLTVYKSKNENLGSVDLRAFVLPGNIGIRIRCGGIQYNPFESDEDADFLMGVHMIEKLAEVVHYSFTLGLNNITILFENAET